MFVFIFGVWFRLEFIFECKLWYKVFWIGDCDVLLSLYGIFFILFVIFIVSIFICDCNYDNEAAPNSIYNCYFNLFI